MALVTPFPEPERVPSGVLRWHFGARKVSPGALKGATSATQLPKQREEKIKSTRDAPSSRCAAGDGLALFRRTILKGDPGLRGRGRRLMTKALVARVVALVYLSTGRNVDAEVLRVFDQALAEVDDWPDVVPIVARLVRVGGFIGAGEVYRAVVAERARAQAPPAAAAHPDSCRCGGTGWLEVDVVGQGLTVRPCPGLSVVKEPEPPAPDPKRWVRRAQRSASDVKGPLGPSLQKRSRRTEPWLVGQARRGLLRTAAAAGATRGGRAMRSGARGPDSDVVIGEGIAWTLHTTTAGYICWYCGEVCPPGSDYWVAHGSELGRVCPLCFCLVFDPTPWGDKR